MHEREPLTQTMKASDARQNFSQVLNRVFKGETRVVVEKSGIPVAAIVSADDLETLNRAEEQRKRDFAILDEIGVAFKDVPPEEIEGEVAKAVAAVRRENRQRQNAQSRRR
jgi:prevent-host-death family protein